MIFVRLASQQAVVAIRNISADLGFSQTMAFPLYWPACMKHGSQMASGSGPPKDGADPVERKWSVEFEYLDLSRYRACWLTFWLGHSKVGISRQEMRLRKLQSVCECPMINIEQLTSAKRTTTSCLEKISIVKQRAFPVFSAVRGGRKPTQKSPLQPTYSSRQPSKQVSIYLPTKLPLKPSRLLRPETLSVSLATH